MDLPNLTQKNKPPLHYIIGLGEVGEAEVEGSANNPRIVEYHKIATRGDYTDEVPWCASYVGWCLKKAGLKPTGTAWARDYLKWGLDTKGSLPKLGDICVFTRGDGGHVGFYHYETETSIILLGGNQSNQVKIAPYPKARLLSIRRAIY